MKDWHLRKNWESSFETFMSDYDDCFLRSETREKASLYVRGVLADVKRKNGWQLSESLGLADPHPLQRLLNEAKWDADKVQKRQREQVMSTLNAKSGALVIDESGFAKKGKSSAGVSPQYCGRSGKVDNCQVGVYLTLATRTGTGILDRRLYLPKRWCEDDERRKKAHIPDEVMFQTKPQLAQAMLAQAWAEGIESRYVTGDALYGNSPTLRQFIADADRLYVLGIGSHHHVEVCGKRQSLSDVFASVEDNQWETIATTVSDTGVIWYNWYALRVFLGADATHEQWVLIRCTTSNELEADEPDYDFFISNAPIETSLTDLVAVASIRHEIEQVFEEAKGQMGLADYEVRTWHGWHRHMTLCFLAHTWLMTISHTERQKKHHSHAG